MIRHFVIVLAVVMATSPLSNAVAATAACATGASSEKSKPRAINDELIDREIPYTKALIKGEISIDSIELRQEILGDHTVQMSERWLDLFARRTLGVADTDYSIGMHSFAIPPKPLPWIKPIERYVHEDVGSKNDFYRVINRKLRKNQDLTADESTWLKEFEDSLAMLAPFEGISFRGTRLKPEVIDSSYIVGEDAKDGGFNSSTIEPAVSNRYAKAEDANDGKIAVILIIEGHSGKFVSFAVIGTIGEQEILFNYTSRFSTVAKSQVFQDPSLGATQFIHLKER